MQVRKKGIIQRIVVISVMLLMLAFLLPQKASASETVLTIVVPGDVTLQLEISGSGKVTYQGTNYTRNTSLSMPRNTEVNFSFSPGRGYEIESVIYNGKSQNDLLVNNTLSLPEVEHDSKLKVVFSRYGDNPLTADTFPLMLYIGIMLTSLFVITIFLVKRRKQ